MTKETPKNKCEAMEMLQAAPFVLRLPNLFAAIVHNTVNACSCCHSPTFCTFRSSVDRSMLVPDAGCSEVAPLVDY